MRFLHSILNTTHRVVMFLIISFCGLCVALYVLLGLVAMWFQYPSPMRNAVLIPAQLGELTAKDQGHDSGWTDGCGASVFSLSPEIIEQILHKQLSFFNGIKTTRDAKEMLLNKKKYSTWYETPLDREIADGRNEESYSSNGAYSSGLRCANKNGMSETLVKQIEAEYKNSGNYYSISHEAILLVSPKLGIVVFAYFG